jgi:hypothetical protein
MMGGTALLEELLAEQAALTAPQEPEPESPSAADLRLLPSEPPLLSFRDGLARVDGTQREIDPLVLPLFSDSGHHAINLETAVAPTSPLSRQIEELAKEMEDCLGSMDNWEDEKLRNRNELLRELEAQYGFAVGNVDLPVDEVQYDSCRDSTDIRSDEVEERWRREASCGGPTPLRHLQGQATSEALARLHEVEATERRLDEERIAQLRAEVEDLRLKSEGPHESVSGFIGRAGGTPHPGLVLDATLSGLDCTLGLQSWREDVDAVLGPSFEDELRYDSSEPDSPCGLARIEGRLVGVRQHARMLEEAVGSAHAYAEDELGQLDQLLSECEELHAHLVGHCSEEIAEPMPLGNSAY